MPGETIYHLALRADWQSALDSGEYTTSTAGRTLAEVGYIHMSREGQVRSTASRFYAGRADVVLLSVDTDRLDADLVDEPVGDEVYPHLFGPLPLSAVTAATELDFSQGDLSGLPARFT